MWPRAIVKQVRVHWNCKRVFLKDWLFWQVCSLGMLKVFYKIRKDACSNLNGCPARLRKSAFLQDSVWPLGQYQVDDIQRLTSVDWGCEEYKDTFISAINAMTKYLFLAKCQANFLRAKKECMKVNEVIVLGDFAESGLVG